jgi:nitroimidazol reductase NimA-like FMN-containing flavoprotein (pyridoxamine 5'-phosphate oxidase superfamily)
MELMDLRREDCLRLLAEGVVGRVVYSDAALPAAHPVTYYLDRDEVVFRAGLGGNLAAAARHQVVGFEIDAYDPSTRTGWSVLGVGVAYEVTDPDRLAALADRMPAPWAPDRAEHTIAVPLQQLSGRRLAPEPVGLDDKAAR